MPFDLADHLDKDQLQMLDAYAQKHSLTHDEALMQLSEGAEEGWLAEQAKRGGVVLPFRRK
ncbi:MAG: hypothetical protein ACRYGA_02220 [Janthinobacterium lividum]